MLKRCLLRQKRASATFEWRHIQAADDVTCFAAIAATLRPEDEKEYEQHFACTVGIMVVKVCLCLA